MIRCNNERTFRKRCFEGDFYRTENALANKLSPEAFQSESFQVTFSLFVYPNEGYVKKNEGNPKDQTNPKFVDEIYWP